MAMDDLRDTSDLAARERLCGLLSAAAGGDRTKEGEFWSEVQPELKRICEQLLARWTNGKISLRATELLDISLLRMLQKGNPLQLDIDYFRKAFAQRCIWILSDHWRDKKRRRNGVVDLHSSGLIDLPGREVETTGDPERLANVLSQLEDLDPLMHSIVSQRLVLEAEFADIARSLGVSLSLVEKRWRRAKAHIRSALAEGA